MTEYSKQLIRFLFHLHNQGAHYLLIGGYAVAEHGYPRYTGDLDVWVEPSLENGQRCIAALQKMEFDVQDISASDFAGGVFFRVGSPPARIDMITETPGLDFSEAYAKRKILNRQGVPIAIIDLDDLIHTKQTLGRLQDLADVEQLQKIRRLKKDLPE